MLIYFIVQYKITLVNTATDLIRKVFWEVLELMVVHTRSIVTFEGLKGNRNCIRIRSWVGEKWLSFS